MSKHALSAIDYEVVIKVCDYLLKKVNYQYKSLDTYKMIRCISFGCSSVWKRWDES